MERFEGMTKVELLAKAESVGLKMAKKTPNAKIMEAILKQETLDSRFLGRRQEKLRKDNGALKLQQVRNGRRFKYLIKQGKMVLDEISSYHKAKAVTRALATAKGLAFTVEKDYIRVV